VCDSFLQILRAKIKDSSTHCLKREWNQDSNLFFLSSKTRFFFKVFSIRCIDAVDTTKFQACSKQKRNFLNKKLHLNTGSTGWFIVPLSNQHLENISQILNTQYQELLSIELMNIYFRHLLKFDLFWPPCIETTRCTWRIRFLWRVLMNLTIAKR
jgi:hypothetical protein